MNKVKVSSLQIGDEIVKFDQSWLQTDFISHKIKISGQSVIEKLQRNGVEYVYIKPKNTELKKLEQLESGNNDEAIQELTGSIPHAHINLNELNHASEIYFESMKIISGVLGDVKSGKMFNSTAVKHIAENITDMTLRNKGAMVSMTKLKKFDDYTFHHSMNVSIFAASLASHLGLDKEDIAIAAYSGLMHDIGKVLIPESILNKPGKLTDEEFKIIKNHVLLGYEFLKRQGVADENLALVLEHHERHDGSGYPGGLKDDQISIHGKIGAVVDIYDAITSDRVYHKGLAATDALKLMFQWTDKHINKSVFEFFVKNIGIYPVGSIVITASGELAVVGKINSGKPTDPVIVSFMKKDGTGIPIKVTDLSKSSIERQKIIGLMNPEDVKIPDNIYKYIDSLNRLV
ncbi:MAG: HD-GYP domain-containing protein [Deferribacterales bacterium]